MAKKSITGKFKGLYTVSILTFLIAAAVNIGLIILISTDSPVLKDGGSYIPEAIGITLILFLVLIGFIVARERKLNKKVYEPIRNIASGLQSLIVGKPSGPSDYHSDDEIGVLADCQRALVLRMSTDIEFFKMLRSGDFSHDLPVPTDADDDSLVVSIQGVIDRQRELISNLRTASEQITAASGEIAAGAQNLASGSNEQSSAIEQFTQTIDTLTVKTHENSDLAREVVEAIKQYSTIVRTIGSDLKRMTVTMSDITESARRISSVSDIIESIAFQTNILALNAAVEAARAGMQGKGFAVVADEVRELSSKSADAARETAELIKADLENVGIGNKIIEDAAAGMAEVERIAAENGQRLVKLEQSSAEQSKSVAEISRSINQISQIVQANSALAEESAASAQELSSQSVQLDELSKNFRIR
jgi:methyl-accepting chemotaxis protein